MGNYTDMTRKKQDVVLDKYQPKKKRNLEMSKMIDSKLSERGLELFKQCSTFNQFIATKDKETKKLTASNPCKNRFCPICAWRKARKDAFMLSILMTAIQVEKKQEFLFLTLTTPNVKAKDLKAEIDRFNKAFSKMFRRRKVMSSIKGYVRKLEITYNKERDDYNPHFHVILAVNKSYFTDPNYYITQKEWLEMWRECTGLTGVTENGTDEITQLYIKKIKGIQEDNAISEVAKYSAKDYEMTVNQQVFDTFYTALKGRQLITFNGVFKEYRKKFELGELDKFKERDTNEYVYKLLATWNRDYLKYKETYELMTEAEKIEFNNVYQDELEIENMEEK